MIDVQRVDYIGIPVTDIDEATGFYGDVLGNHRYAPYGPRDG